MAINKSGQVTVDSGQLAARKFVRKKQLKTNLEEIQSALYTRNLELAETNKILSLLRNIDHLVLGSQDSLAILSQQIASVVADTGDYPIVGLFVHRPHSGRLELTGFKANEQIAQFMTPAVTDKLLLESDADWLKEGEPSSVINTDKIEPAVLHKLLRLPPKIAEQLIQTPAVHSLYVAKLMARQKLVGLVVIGMVGQTHVLHTGDSKSLDRLAQAVGVAIDNRLLYEENQRIVIQLQKSNQKLKDLDEAKDEFISMASHQLRTPLTSVKGYVDMVVQGDAGKVNSDQSKLLKQAFSSAQRMVYLISDLLNVSRLKTGKFVIEPVATNLAEVVETEVDQLKETAKGRGLELIYKKPVKFPTLMLDETKIRQVMMNFMDNAIYYTPEGGKIIVALTQTSKSVEFTVTDNGLGVPKEDQKNLFTKFFRASNAKRARPDGTGLGIFMAKKVVVVQGGAIIFKSKEGAGSTFGFSFPKAKLKAK